MARSAPGGATTRIPKAKLRRIALEQQGLLKQAPFGRGKNATLRAIEQIGYVQIDTISVVARAHDHVLHARVPNYNPDHLTSLQREGRIFEYWYHAAAYLPIRDYRFALPRMRDMSSHQERWIRSRDQKLMAEVQERIRQEGPLKARDFENPQTKNSGWWDWKPAKAALEQLFMQGDLMVAGRDGFQKTYDLTERLLPADVNTQPPDDYEMAEYLLRTMLRGHGFVTPKSVTHLRRGKNLRSALKAVLEARLAQRELVTIRLPSDEIAYADPELLEQRAPPVAERATLLSPFDNLVIHRARVQAVFDFDFQIECYLNEANRRFGYFCLPVVYRDQLVGRADCKAHRDQAHFEIKHLHVEDEHLDIDDNFTDTLASTFQRFARFNNCETLSISHSSPQQWLEPIRQALG
jgi:uncharacterized protein YcaQ